MQYSAQVTVTQTINMTFEADSLEDAEMIAERDYACYIVQDEEVSVDFVEAQE